MEGYQRSYSSLNWPPTPSLTGALSNASKKFISPIQAAKHKHTTTKKKSNDRVDRTRVVKSQHTNRT